MPAFAAKKSKWKKAGFLVRNVTTTRDVATTGYEVLDGKGLPIKIVDQKTGEELNELLPLTGSLNLVRRTAAAQFGYTKQVVVHENIQTRVSRHGRSTTGQHCGTQAYRPSKDANKRINRINRISRS